LVEDGKSGVFGQVSTSKKYAKALSFVCITKQSQANIRVGLGEQHYMSRLCPGSLQVMGFDLTWGLPEPI
jgi:hypothetical protein